MDRLTFELIAAHHPRRIVVDYDNDLWHAGCMLKDNNGIYTYGVRRGPDAFEMFRDGSRDKCWWCRKSDAEPWTD